MTHDAAKIFTIADLASEFGITARTLRYYEDQNLITPKREGQNRIYTARDRARIAWILRGRRMGFSLAEIAELLDLYYVEGGPVIQMRAALEKSRGRVEQLQQQRNDIDEMIIELEKFSENLEQRIARSGTDGERKAG